ncbi:MAG: EFR1 family ferrodoxin [Oscillospiraceae bacterium]|nr:EFR1 family ferrodoxin [Oscillospiraceae bacterium]
MLSLYFSGTGNTRHLAELLAKKLGCPAVSIEAQDAAEQIARTDSLIFAFPIYMTNMPGIVRDYINGNAEFWKGKRVFILAACAMVSGAAVANAAALFRWHGAEILGGETVKMPDNIGDVRLITTLLPKRRNPKVLSRADKKISALAELIERGAYPRHGLSAKAHPQAEKPGNPGPKIDKAKCDGCGICKKNCPSPQKCTLCYRCFNLCPQQAITLMGDKVRLQYLYEDLG